MRNPAAAPGAQPQRPPPIAKAEATAGPQLVITPEMREQLGLVTAGGAHHQRSSELRHIKRQVMAEIRAKPEERVILVTSCMAGEGKSFTTANLAASLALEHEHSLLLIDADAVKPFLTRTLKLNGQPGLMDALADPARDAESLVWKTDIPGLSVLPAGAASDFTTEYFSSSRLRDVVDQLMRVPNRIILIDSLPMLLTTEAPALLPVASQILMVVRAERTSQAAAREALNLIGDRPNVKLILNGVTRTRLSSYLGYDSGFTYERARYSEETK
jgi:Mrp family chromosome partitioning ATPase